MPTTQLQQAPEPSPSEPAQLNTYEEAFLLGLDGQTGVPMFRMGFPLIAAAVLADLQRLQRIRIHRRKVHAIPDSEPTGNPVLDRAFDRISNHWKPKSIGHWVQSLVGRKSNFREIGQTLAEAGLVTYPAPDFPASPMPTFRILDPAAQFERTQRLREWIETKAQDDSHALDQLPALARSTGLLTTRFGEEFVFANHAHLKSLRKRSPIAKYLRWYTVNAKGSMPMFFFSALPVLLLLGPPIVDWLIRIGLF